MKVIAYDKFPNEQAAKEENFTYMTKDEVFANADVISLHCPLFPETRHTINEESIAKMKDGVIIINSARGGLVDVYKRQALSCYATSVIVYLYLTQKSHRNQPL